MGLTTTVNKSSSESVDDCSFPFMNKPLQYSRSVRQPVYNLYFYLICQSTDTSSFMRFNLDFNNSGTIIRGYREGSVTVNDQEIRQSVIITPGQILPWPPQSFADLETAHLADLSDLEPELVLLGTGNRQQFPPPAITHPLLNQGIGVEVMDTAAACRTYNILVAEGRRVVAALLMI
jgi:uncharacterized protein